MTLSPTFRRLALPGVVAILLAYVAFASLTTPGFFTLGNLQAILTSTIFVGMVAVGMTLVMISGAFVSLALGTTATAAAMLYMSLLPWGLPAAIILTLLAALMVGAVQGIAIGGWNANSIIVTIAVAAVMEGVAVALSGGATINPVGTGYRALNERYWGLPVGFYVLILLALAAEIILRYSKFGRMVYLMGDRRAAARVAALPLTAIGAGVFAFASATAAFAGIFMGTFNHSASLLLSRGSLSYDAIAAVLIGGAAIGGGRGSVIRSMLGVIVIAVVTDLVLLQGYSVGAQIAVKGLVMTAFAVAIHLRQASST
jgi:simple sugar transport system permease protein/ribose transport system permease protein